jgi:hypothetical protein
MSEWTVPDEAAVKPHSSSSKRQLNRPDKATVLFLSYFPMRLKSRAHQ